jgi:hypothetical protein
MHKTDEVESDLFTELGIVVEERIAAATCCLSTKLELD